MTFGCPKINPTSFIWNWIIRDLYVIRSLAELALLTLECNIECIRFVTGGVQRLNGTGGERQSSRTDFERSTLKYKKKWLIAVR